MSIDDVLPFARRLCSVYVRDAELGGGFQVTGIIEIVNDTRIRVNPVATFGGPVAPFGDGTFEIAKIRSIETA
jgi:hypothetical protein